MSLASEGGCNVVCGNNINKLIVGVFFKAFPLVCHPKCLELNNSFKSWLRGFNRYWCSYSLKGFYWFFSVGFYDYFLWVYIYICVYVMRQDFPIRILVLVLLFARTCRKITRMCNSQIGAHKMTHHAALCYVYRCCYYVFVLVQMYAFENNYRFYCSCFRVSLEWHFFPYFWNSGRLDYCATW